MVKNQRLQTDRGTEFICKTFEKYFKDEMIFHYLSYSDRKCPVVERFNLAIQQLIYKIMEYKSTTFDETDFTTENEGLTNDDLENKTKKVYVGFINDDNIPDIIETDRSKWENRKEINKKKINKRKIDIPKLMNNKKVLKVNVIDDEQIEFLKKLKRK